VEAQGGHCGDFLAGFETPFSIAINHRATLGSGHFDSIFDLKIQVFGGQSSMALSHAWRTVT
jgi:hypothetical protein